MYMLPVLVMSLAYSIIVYTLKKRRVPGVQTDRTLYIQQRTRRKVGVNHAYSIQLEGLIISHTILIRYLGISSANQPFFISEKLLIST